MKNRLLGLLSICLFISAFTTCSTTKEINSPKKTTTVILVRHAEKADDGTSDPALTTIGQERAQRLAGMLAPSKVDAVYSTPYQRTRLTGHPLAKLMNLEMKEYDPRDQDFVATVVKDHPSQTILLVGHSNTVPMMVNNLIGEQRYEQLDEKEYDKLFIVEVASGKGKALVLSF